MARVSRRRFLAFLSGGVVLVGAVFAGLGRWSTLFSRRRRSAPLGPVAATDVAPGPLSKEVSDLLVKASSVILGYPIETSHYVDYFAFRAARLPHYRALYERFASELAGHSQALWGRALVDCDDAQWSSVLAKLLPEKTPTWDVLGPLEYAPLPRPDAHADLKLLCFRYFVMEVTSVFASTDAWHAMGYDSWPGVPAGLESYRIAPRAPL